MGATWVSLRPTVYVIITMLQIRALNSVKTTVATGVEGQSFDFRCEYSRGWESNAKYLCHVDDNESSRHLIRTAKQNQWVTEGRFSLYDNTSGAFFIIRVDELLPNDSGTYWCGVDINNNPDHISVIKLNVSRVNVIPTFPMDIHPKVEKLNLSLFLTAVMCVAATLFVCLFTICLLMMVKNRGSGLRQNRQMSTDYETMMPGVSAEPEHCCCSCSVPDHKTLSALPPPPPDFCSYLTSKQRESIVSLGLSEYVDVDLQGHTSQYQHLDHSCLEEHVYDSLHGNSCPKHRPAKEQINCTCNS